MTIAERRIHHYLKRNYDEEKKGLGRK